MSTYKDKIKGLVCLVPNKSLITSESFSLSSHEKTLCDCQVLEIVREIESENEKLKELLRGLNTLTKFMYEKMPCDSTYSENCTPCSYDDFLNANNLEDIFNKA